MGTFIIDKQTFNDLNIFSEDVSSNSILNLFKYTRTLGGRKRLIEMMNNPLNNLCEISSRRDSISFFFDNKINFDIKNEEIDLIDFYLESKFKHFKNNPLDALSDYLTRNSSNHYYIIRTGLRYLIQTTKYILDFIKDQKANNPSKYLLQIFDEILDIIDGGVLMKASHLNEKRLSFFVVTNLDRAIRGAEKHNIKKFLQLMYELDVFENVALVAASKGFSFPIFNNDEDLKINITGLFHPSIKNPVRNDLHLDVTKNIIFLTGSNMAGKSSLLKSLGLTIYLSHLGFPVPAETMKLSVFNGMATTINLPDNINEGLSHYYTEVKRVKEVAEILLRNQNIFVIFDELFRGTNVKDAYDASYLIISELSAIRNSAFIISTHIIELAASLNKFKNISFGYLDTYFENQKPVFTYSLKEGISNETLGMYIVKNEGIVEVLKMAAKKSLCKS